MFNRKTTCIIFFQILILSVIFTSCKNLLQLERKNLLVTGDTSQVTFTSAIFQGNIIDISNVASGKIIQHGHCWSLESGKASVNSSDTTQLGARDSSGIYTSTIRGLKPNSIYYVRGYVSSSKETVYGDEVLLITKSGSAVRNIGVSNIRSNSALASAFIGLFGLNVIQYGHCWSSTEIIPELLKSEGSTSLTAAIGSTGTISFTSDLTNLVSGKTYYVRAYLLIDAGNGQKVIQYGESIYFKTP